MATALHGIIAETIRREGPIGIDRYWDLALYHREHGYYTSREPFDVVLLDAEMHPLDGWATTAEIRRDAALAALPVLMVSASVQAHHRARARQVGVGVFIPKPFEPSAVVEVVERLAGAARRGP